MEYGPFIDKLPNLKMKMFHLFEHGCTTSKYVSKIVYPPNQLVYQFPS